MKLNTLVSLFAICASTTISYSQSNDPIRLWIQSHPEVSLIEASYYNQLSQESVDLLKGKYLVYYAPLTLDQLEAYEQKENAISTNEVNQKETSQFIKDWLGAHPGIKVIKQSEFKEFREEDQLFYLNDNNCIVLAGEEITPTDIETYNLTH